MNHPVRIDHWENLKDKIIPQNCCLLVLGDEKTNKIMKNPAGNCFSGMGPGQKDNDE
jgi:hypothetical protein